MVDIFTVDAFTDSPFSGNPAGVCVLSSSTTLSDESMQNIAAEMNLSETAFIHPIDGDIQSASSFTLKWFTPICEIKLCGHGTLGTAAVIYQIYQNTNPTLSFTTLSGTLRAVLNKSNNKITLDFPSSPPLQRKVSDFYELVQVIADPKIIVDCRFSPSANKLLLRLPDGTSRGELESLCVDTNRLMTVNQRGGGGGDSVKGIIVTVKSNDEQYDFYSRYFAPWVGINEDPVTGSAHTVSGPYWSEVLHKKTMNARQCSKRGGDLVVGIEEGERVSLTGSAVIVLQGKIYC